MTHIEIATDARRHRRRPCHAMPRRRRRSTAGHARPPSQHPFAADVSTTRPRSRGGVHEHEPCRFARKFWPSGHPRILTTDAWLANAGDAALAIATETLVRRCAPEAAILHAAYHGAELGPRLPQLRFTAPLDQLTGSACASPAEGWQEVQPTLVAGADAVISLGGGFLSSIGICCARGVVRL